MTRMATSMITMKMTTTTAAAITPVLSPVVCSPPVPVLSVLVPAWAIEKGSFQSIQ